MGVITKVRILECVALLLILSWSFITALFFLTARRVWRDYFPAVDAMVFLVDACDHARLAESKEELDALLTDETLANCPVLVLGNKIDRPNACSEEELRNIFGLNCTTGKVRLFTFK